MITRLALTVLVACAALPGPAPAAEVDGEVPSMLALALQDGAPAADPSAGAGRVSVRVWSTYPGSELTAEERGAGAGVSPLATRVGRGPLLPSDGPFGAALTAWAEPVSGARVAVEVRRAPGRRPAAGAAPELVFTLAPAGP